MSCLCIYLITPGCGAYSNRVWVREEKWFELPKEERDVILKHTLWGNYDKQCHATEMDLTARLGDIISFEVDNKDLGKIVQLMVCGVDSIPQEKEFTIYWRYNEKSIVKGFSEQDAFTKAGFGAGALNAVDFFMAGNNNEYKWNEKTKYWDKILNEEVQHG